MTREGTFSGTAEFIDRRSRTNTPTVEGVPLAETEMFDDGIVAEAGVRSTKSPQHTALHLETTVEAFTPGQALVKRCLDVVVAALGLFCLAPVYLIIAVLVALDSPGPVLFSQTRVGLRGRTFRMLKFRTMYEGADKEKDAMAELNHADDSRLFKIPSDPRVTRLGRVLRRWSLDELPQLCNVLMGEMSLVGPRPFFESDLDDYEAHHFRRLSVPAGLTGLWQVSGRSDIVDFEEVVRLDRHYIENWSFVMDLRILVRTLPTVMSRRGAY
jgi:lipopolysaccharide/colanic/teichoic acid biosynthesis glycosyltransferase